MDLKSRIEDLAAIPKKLSGILEMASEGKLKVDIAAKEVGQLSNTINSAVDKLVICVLFAAIVIGLSLVMMSQYYSAGIFPLLAYIGAIIIIIVVFFTMRQRIKRQR